MTQDNLAITLENIRYADYNEIKQISRVMKIRKETLAKEVINTYTIGDLVEFDHNGRTIKGTIAKVKIKRITVKTDEGRWDVPALVLQPTPAF